MDLICYLHPGWAPYIRPAPATRAWMDATPESFAYRCLPLNIANAHGWELLSSCGFEAVWDGGSGTEAVTIRLDGDPPATGVPVSLFGQGILTFHVEGIVRTPPGWDLWIGGSPNRPKDAIQPLSAVVETDWSPFTFTMNWKFTRVGDPIRFEALEPFGFIFPLPRGAVEAFKPRFAPIQDEPALLGRFKDWSAARDAFQERMRENPPAIPADRWQKHYYRGVDVRGEALISDHRTKLRLAAFDRSSTPGVPSAPAQDAPSPPPVTARAHIPAEPHPDLLAKEAEIARLSLALAKRDWLLQTLERHRDLSPRLSRIERRSGLTADAFLDEYYAAHLPVILTGEMETWPALRLWTPDYLKDRVGRAVIEFQGGRSADPQFEVNKDPHRQTAAFDRFIDEILKPGAGNDAYLTAYNSATNAGALAPLASDTGRLELFLDPAAPQAQGMMWIGPAGTVTPLHHDLTNNFIAQVVGRKRIQLVPAAETAKLYNHRHVFSEIADIEAPTVDSERFPLIAEVRAHEILLQPGEILFVPVGWWHQVKALDFSVTLTFTNFRWPNDAHADYPPG